MLRAIHRSWRLTPVRHEEPRCTDFADPVEVERHERAMRVHRAWREPFRIAMLDDRIDGAYRVASGSGQVYLVDLVDCTLVHDSCTCPDFFSNELGTCKHLEAVRRALGADRRLRATYQRLPSVPARPTLVVQGRGELRLRLIGPRTRSFARALRLDVGEEGEVRSQAALDLALANAAGGRIVHAAPRAFASLCERRELAMRTSSLRHTHELGELRLSLLREPLFSYQEAGVLHLAAGGRALLADDMGLGKTVQAIAACELLRARGEARRILIVTPASLKEQWAREIRRYAGAEAVVVGGGASQRGAQLASDAAYTIINYELTWRDLGILQSLQPDVLVLDEAQRAKNFRTKTAATLRAMPSRFLFVLTGTPLENRLDDLYSLLQLVDPRTLGPLWRFNLAFHEQNARGKITGYKGLGALRERIAPIVLRRRKDEVLTQLPPLTEQTRYIPLSPAQTELEEHFRREASKLLSTAERRALTPEEQQRLMAMLLKARQACNAAELCDPTCERGKSPKLDELEQLVAEIVAQGADKILVFSEWTEMLRLAVARLEAIGVGHRMLHGGVPTHQRAALLDDFRSNADARVLLSTDAGGVGLNLQVASYVIHLDLPWNPGRLDQRTARAHRLGQTRGVSATYLCAEQGIERGIEGTLAGKRALRAAALDPGSTVDTLEAPSFAVFMRELQTALDRTRAAAAQEPAMSNVAEAAPYEPTLEVGGNEQPSIALADEEKREELGGRADALPPSAPMSRLRLAKVVLEAGFPGDAVRAAYEGLSSGVRAQLSADVPPSHAALIAAVYRELVPAGRAPAALHGALARLYDLSQLEAHGVRVEHALATDAVAEAEAWISRLNEDDARMISASREPASIASMELS